MPGSPVAITETFGPGRSAQGAPSEWDFWGGPLAAAVVAFREFEVLRFDEFPAVRTLHLFDPIFGPVVLSACSSNRRWWSLPPSPTTPITGS